MVEVRISRKERMGRCAYIKKNGELCKKGSNYAINGVIPICGTHGNKVSRDGELVLNRFWRNKLEHSKPKR